MPKTKENLCQKMKRIFAKFSRDRTEADDINVMGRNCDIFIRESFVTRKSKIEWHIKSMKHKYTKLKVKHTTPTEAGKLRPYGSCPYRVY